MPRQARRGTSVFQCDFPSCGKTYKHNSSLIRHSRTHASRRSRYKIRPESEPRLPSEPQLPAIAPFTERPTPSPSPSHFPRRRRSFSTRAPRTPPLPLSPWVQLMPQGAETRSQSHRNGYSYQPIASSQLRLLLLARGLMDDPIECKLRVVDEVDVASRTLQFQALSYAWGPSSDNFSIFISDWSDNSTSIPRRFNVRYNLSRALGRIRSSSQDLWFWIDAICIDQDNKAEKAHQLPKMLDIYNNATNVSIWLGENEEEVHDGNQAIHSGHRAMYFVDSLVDLPRLEVMASRRPSDETAISWLAFANLLKRPWFTRRWVVQEVAAARKAAVRCGDIIMNWIDFADAIQLFMSKLDSIRSQYEGCEISRTHPDGLKHVESLGARAIVSKTNIVLRKADEGDVLEKLHRLEELVLDFQHFDVSDPRDTIYALLPLSRTEQEIPSSHKWTTNVPPPLVPDYSKPTVQVYIEFIQHTILCSNSLDIICRHWALPLRESVLHQTAETSDRRSRTKATSASEFPLWIGLTADSPFGPPSMFTGRINGDSLVGDPSHRVYNASNGRPPSVRFGTTSTGSFDGTLFARGIHLCTVIRKEGRVVNGTISDEALGVAGWTNDDDIDDIPDRVWTTLVADRAEGADGTLRNAPFWYRRACIHCLRNASAEGDLNTSTLINNPTFPETVIEYLRRVRAVVWSRTFIACQDVRNEAKRSYGLGSRYTEVGDVVCILFGCSVPVVLRKHKDGFYEFVGESYIHGYMDGQAYTDVNDDAVGNLEVEFKIR